MALQAAHLRPARGHPGRPTDRHGSRGYATPDLRPSPSARSAHTRLESDLRHAERLAAVGRQTSGVAHDFKNLLAIILSSTDCISEELGDHPLQRELAEVRTATRLGVELTRQLLRVPSWEDAPPEVLDVNAALEAVVDILRRALGTQIELRTVLGPDLPAVFADPGQLEQVLVNLAVNARDAIAGPGRVTAETSIEHIDADAARAQPGARPGRYVRVAVTDSGCGMTAEVAARVFEPFFTTKAAGKGTGLGLSTVANIARRYGGYATLTSHPGEGTTVAVHLPAVDEPIAHVSPTQPVAAPDAGAGSGETVLLVEDESALRAATRRILEQAGYRVIEAADGFEALSALDGDRFDLLLTDVVMPGGLSGRDVARRVRGLQPDVRVLYMSGYSAAEMATAGIIDAGAPVVEKPFRPRDLLGQVRAALV